MPELAKLGRERGERRSFLQSPVIVLQGRTEAPRQRRATRRPTSAEFPSRTIRLRGDGKDGPRPPDM